MRKDFHRRNGLLACCALVVVFVAAAPPAEVQFTDITQSAGINFKDENSATSNKYLIETMGGGVAFLDYDNDGRLDIFFVNGAKIDDPMRASLCVIKSVRLEVCTKTGMALSRWKLQQASGE